MMFRQFNSKSFDSFLFGVLACLSTDTANRMHSVPVCCCCCCVFLPVDEHCKLHSPFCFYFGQREATKRKRSPKEMVNTEGERERMKERRGHEHGTPWDKPTTTTTTPTTTKHSRHRLRAFTAANVVLLLLLMMMLVLVLMMVGCDFHPNNTICTATFVSQTTDGRFNWILIFQLAHWKATEAESIIEPDFQHMAIG